MPGYSDRINHALAFAAKYRAPHAPAEGTMSFHAHPANVAVILARHDVDEITVVAGIVHHVLEVTPGIDLVDLEHKIDEKFGPIVLAVAREAVEPHWDERGARLTWAQRKRALLGQLLVMSPRALDISCADEIHQCGTAIGVVDRLGEEYLGPHGLPHGPGALSWYDDVLAALERRLEWPNRGMRHELAALRRQLADTLARGS
jgi:HD domain